MIILPKTKAEYAALTKVGTGIIGLMTILGGLWAAQEKYTELVLWGVQLEDDFKQRLNRVESSQAENKSAIQRANETLDSHGEKLRLFEPVVNEIHNNIADLNRKVDLVLSSLLNHHAEGQDGGMQKRRDAYADQTQNTNR